MSISLSLKITALVSVATAATAPLIQACGGGVQAQGAEPLDAIECVLKSVATTTEHASGAVHRTIAMASDNNSFTGVAAGLVLDNNKAVLQSVCGSEAATRARLAGAPAVAPAALNRSGWADGAPA